MQITDKVFVVTGGGNGIGREVVVALLARGARVAALDLSETGLAETAELAAAPDGRLSTHVVNIADRDAVLALPATIVEAHGQVDGVLNVAGIIQKFVKVADLEFADMERVMNVNFWGTVNVVKAFLPLLQERPEAALVNVSSMGALAPVPGQAVYGASKAAVKLLTEALYAELRGTRVAVTIVFPGAIGTNISVNSGVATPEAAASQASSSTMKTTAPADAGRRIVEALEKGSYRLRIGSDAVMLDRLSRFSPRRATEMIADRMKSLLG